MDSEEIAPGAFKERAADNKREKKKASQDGKS